MLVISLSRTQRYSDFAAIDAMFEIWFETPGLHYPLKSIVTPETEPNLSSVRIPNVHVPLPTAIFFTPVHNILDFHRCCLHPIGLHLNHRLADLDNIVAGLQPKTYPKPGQIAAISTP